MRFTNNKTVRTFLNLRFYLAYTVLLAYILYDWFNLHNFLLVLAITVVSITLLAVVIACIKQKRRDMKNKRSASNTALHPPYPLAWLSGCVGSIAGNIGRYATEHRMA